MFNSFHRSIARRKDINPSITLVRTSHGDVCSVITFKTFNYFDKRKTKRNLTNG